MKFPTRFCRKFHLLRHTVIAIAAVAFFGRAAIAEEDPTPLQGTAIEYASGKTELEGFIVYNPEAKAPVPGILIVPDWMGVSEFDRSKARELAQKGYAAFVVDIYGKDVRPKDAKEAGELAGKYKADRGLLRERMKAAFNAFGLFPQVDKKRIGVMGYCFGGTAALELARSGAPVAVTVSFHGGLSTPNPADARNIKTPVLVLHGADDPYVPRSEVKAFEREMEEADVSMTFIEYPGAVHAFTHPSAGDDNSKGAAYNAHADKESWREFLQFIAVAFKE